MSTWAKFNCFLPSVNKVMTIRRLLMLTIGFNGENQFFSYCKKSNIDLSIKPECVSL